MLLGAKLSWETIGVNGPDRRDGGRSDWADEVGMLSINRHLGIDEGELRFTFVGSPGPGGQNVNKLATTAVLWFDVEHSPSLNEGQRARLREALAARLSKDGVLQLTARRQRSQSANRAEAVARFVELLAQALRPRRRRIPTKPSAGSRERRLEGKARRSRIKSLRKRDSGPGYRDD
jgi:ribosome-associated protein